ncbi:MAG: Mu transposase C-terminal domain-containing protein [Pseudomonadota bacterium]
MKSTFKLKPGLLVAVAGERHIVVEVKNLENVLCRRLSNNETELFPIRDLKPLDDQELVSNKTPKKADYASVSPEIWRQASEQMEVIRKLHALGRNHRTREQVEAGGKLIGKSRQTIYRWLKDYERDGTIATFLPKERSDKGQSRLSPEIDAIVMESIKRLLLKREADTVKSVFEDVKNICKTKGLKRPGITAIRERFLAIPEKERVSSRQGKKVAKEKFTPIRGSFPGAEHPLDVIQIDHTPVDFIIVDEVYRKEIGRPTLTIAIDVYSRVLLGFNLWLEPPSAASVGLCLYHAMLPKEKWLADRKINATWRCYGKPRKIHTDNAKEFKGTVLGRACESYGIDLEQRPKGSPNYGGHVERGFRTFMRKTHTLPGTTFSNTKSKFDYDSAGKAIMTLREFEHWFVIYITKVYHMDFHTGVKNTPIGQYEEGILGTDEKLGIGIPELFTDEETLQLDFMPFFERTVQEYGVLLDNVHYYDDVLRPRIHERDPLNPKSARKFIFRRDPSDISVIYFWDPDLSTYREIPYSNRSRPPISLWEVRAAVREQIAKGKANVDENSIFEGVTEMREIEANAAHNTKTARRNEQRRRDAEKRKKNTADTKPEKSSTSKAVQKQAPQTVQMDSDEDVVQAFDDLDMRL